MASDLTLEVVTPFGKAYSNEITSCTIPGEEGEFQILKDHAALVSLVSIGPVKVQESDGKIVHMAVSSGYCEVKDNRVRVMVESAELAEQIDMERARKAKERAEKRLQEHAPDVDVDRARMALARALNRMKLTQLR